MARASNSSRFGILILVLIAAAVIGYVWIRRHHASVATAVAPEAAGTTAANGPKAVSSDKIDPANEGRPITLTGDLKVVKGAHDTQLGIDADAVALLRYADMLQWQEQCAPNGTNCKYTQTWSPQLISSKKFHDAEGHQNPTRLPVTIGRYGATELKLGAFRVDTSLFLNMRSPGMTLKPEPFPVKSSELPSNLAASFREHDGMLYAGDPDHRAVGDVRVIYRVIPAGKVEISGFQRGDTIVVTKAKSIAQ